MSRGTHRMRLWVGGCVGLVLLGGVLYGWLAPAAQSQRANGRATTRSTPTGAGQDIEPVEAQGSGHKVQSATSQPLFALLGNSELQALEAWSYADAAPVLEAQARAGNTQAAVALHRRLAQCARDRSMQRFRPMWEQRWARNPAPTDRERAEHAWSEQIQCHLQQRCKGTTHALESEGLEWLVRAALAGDVEARTRFALGSQFSWGELNDLDHAGLYLERGVQWLHEGTRAGYAPAFRALIDLYTGNLTPGSRTHALEVTPDPIQAGVLIVLESGLRSGRLQTGRQVLRSWVDQGKLDLSEPEQEAVMRLAQAWRSEHPDARWRRLDLDDTDIPKDQIRRVTPECVRTEAPEDVDAWLQEAPPR